MSEYPTEEELGRIKAWPYEDPAGWFAYIKSAGRHWWSWSERDDVDKIDKAVHVYEVSTGGWSSSEDIIDAMQKNQMLWLLTWQVSRRGGHFTFTVKR